MLTAAETDSGRMSIQEHSPGADERSVEAFHQHLQSSEETLATSHQGFINLVFLKYVSTD